MTQLTSLKFLLYENETSSHGPKNCQKIGDYDKKNMKLLKKTRVKNNIFKSTIWVF